MQSTLDTDSFYNKSYQTKSLAVDFPIPLEFRKFVRAKDGAEYLSISLSHFHSLVRQGKLPEGKLITGAVRVWKVSELDQAADKMWGEAI